MGSSGSAAFRAAVTDDFVLNEYTYRESALGRVLETVSDTAEGTARAVEFSGGYRVEQVGERIVIGEGPWFVSVGENWTAPGTRYQRTAGYVIVDEGATLRIANHYWTGIEYAAD